MRGDIGDDLVGGDAHLDGTTDGFALDLARDEVRVAGFEVAEEVQDGYLQR